MQIALDYNLDTLLQLVRMTDCRPFVTIGIVQFITSREEFKKSVQKFIKGMEKKEVKCDKVLVFGEWKGITYNRIHLIKFTDNE